MAGSKGTRIERVADMVALEVNGSPQKGLRKTLLPFAPTASLTFSYCLANFILTNLKGRRFMSCFAFIQYKQPSFPPT